MRYFVSVFFCLLIFISPSDAYQEFILDGKETAFSEVGAEPLTSSSYPMVPRGSAVLGPSGALAASGISHIIHVAPGSMTSSRAEFAPTRKGLTQSVINALIIAKNKKFKCVALPFIGSGIFLSSLKMTKSELAQTLVSTIEKEKPQHEVIFVTWETEDSNIFKETLKGIKDSRFKQVQGSITDFKVHQCPVIMNAANMEMEFGGGVSGAIGRATGDAEGINKLNKALILKLKNKK